MKRKFHRANWAAGPIIGGLAILLMQGCSGTTTETSPRIDTASSQTVQSYIGNKSIEKVDLQGVEFRRDGSIRPNSTPILDTAITLLESKPNATVYVDSYCDPTGGKDLNQKLSEQRSAAVASYLREHGVPADRIVPRAFGASHFVASNATPSGRAQNRRIELVIQPASA